MARLCEPCRFHSADDSLKACPDCGGAVKFTLLPPPGEEAKPLGGFRRSAPAPSSPPKSAQLGIKIGIGAIAVVVLAVGIKVALALFSGEAFQSQASKVKVGMPMVQAARIMGDPDVDRSKKFTIQIGDPGPSEDRFPVFDYNGSGYVEYTTGWDSAVRINFENGIVTGVVPTTRQTGLRKRTTIETP